MIKYLQIFIALIVIQAVAAAYNEQTAKQYAYLSAITHCSKTVIEKWNCKDCSKVNLVNVTYLENSKLHIVGFIGYEKTKNRIAISWRGTIDTRNWIEDGNFEQIPYGRCSGCFIHLGFYESFKSVQTDLFNAIQKLLQLYPTAKIGITGHSLGGALGEVCAMQVQSKFGKVVELYSYGKPRVGNKNLSLYTKSVIPSIFRVVHNKDIVPHLPPQKLNYAHTAFEVFYDQNMSSYKICDASGQDKSCSDKFFPDFSPNDHDPYWFRFTC